MNRKGVLVFLLQELENKGIKTTMHNIQHIVFFLKEYCGIPLWYNYDVLLYGPYSYEIQEEIEDMKFWDELRLVNGEYIISDLGVIDNTVIKEKIDECIEKFKRIVNNAPTFSNVEVAGMLLYSISALKSFGMELTKESVIDEFKQWRGNKYPDEQIERIYENIRTEGLL